MVYFFAINIIFAKNEKQRYMKPHFYRLFLMANIILLSLVSCEKSAKVEPVLVRVSYTPSFHNPAEIIVDLKGKTLMFFSPYEVELPPPLSHRFNSEEDSLSYQKYISERPQAEPFVSEITEFQAKDIQNSALKLKDFQKNEDELFFDGMTVNAVISYSDKSVKQIEVQPSGEYSLYRRLIHLALAKNKSKNNTIILNEIEDYF